MKENGKLVELYNSKWEALSETLVDFNNKIRVDDDFKKLVANPLLLQIDENYANAELKIMFFGQETNGWGEDFTGEIEPEIQRYIRFYLNDGYKQYGGQFWNGVNRMKQIFNINSNKTVGYIWNNVVKIGLCSKGYPYESHKFTLKYFDVLKAEIKILKPDVLIFLSGPGYDIEIENAIGEYLKSEIDGFSLRKLCEFKFKEDLGIKKAFRTYHPNYLWRNGIDDYFNAISNEIKGIL